MKAVILRDTGDATELSVEEIKIPACAADEVLIKVNAFSINPIDVKTRKGNRFSEKLLTDTPAILGWDLSGTVEQLGSDVDQFRHGTRVFGMVNFPGFGKTYAEYAVAKPQGLMEVPEHIDDIHAAATPLAALTAFQALKQYARLKAGTRVLIHGGGGGVGHFAVQIARHFGAHITVTASESKKDFVLELGADKHIDYEKVRFEEETGQVDVVFDLIGGPYIDRSLEVLEPGGIIISVPTATNTGVEEKARAKGCTGIAFKLKQNPKDMEEITSLLQQGILIPYVSETFPMDAIRQAHLAMEKGGTKGKIVVTTSR